jgi:hypothetical protein
VPAETVAGLDLDVLRADADLGESEEKSSKKSSSSPSHESVSTPQHSIKTIGDWRKVKKKIEEEEKEEEVKERRDKERKRERERYCTKIV